MKPSGVTELEERIKSAGECLAQLKTENCTLMRTGSLLWSGWFVLWSGYTCEVVTPRERKNIRDNTKTSLMRMAIKPPHSHKCETPKGSK
jgi:hypothetical protein